MPWTQEGARGVTALLDILPLATMAFDHDHRITEISGEAAALLGGPGIDLRGRSVVETLVDGEGHLGFLDLMDELERESRLRPHVAVSTMARDLRFRTAGGVLVTLSATAMHLPGGSSTSLLALTSSTTDRRVRAGHLSALHRDALTGLPTRPALVDDLRSALARLGRHPGYLGVIFIDLDRMKAINDRLGHEVGDRFLCDIAARLRGTLREVDSIARFGGDEFVIVIADAESPERIGGVAHRLRGAVSQPMICAGEAIEASASIGIAITEDASATPEDLIRDADTAMYESKRNRGGAPVLFSSALRKAVGERVRLEADLRRALVSREIEAHFQPIVRLGGGIVGAEALVRWRHSERGLVAPGEFLPLAEETGLVHGLWQVMVEEACRSLRMWREVSGQPSSYVSVNLSPRQFSRAELVPRLLDMVEQSGIEPGGIRIEITETALVDDAALAHRVLDGLATAGFGIALDDFGTGYSSLSHLQEYPVTMVKIDRSFTHRLLDHPRDAAIVRAIVDLGHALGLEVCAEGVETAQQATALVGMSCHLGQGYFWGAAESADDFAQRLVAA